MSDKKAKTQKAILTENEADSIFSSKQQLFERLEFGTQVFQNPNVKAAFLDVDRKDFVGSDYKVEAYEDYPLPTCDEQTISQPTTVAFMLELLDTKPGDVVLDIGSGSGWTSALLAHMAGDEGMVYGLEVRPELVNLSKEYLKKYPQLHVEIIQAKPETGYYAKAPFNRILGGAAFKEKGTAPMELMFQLALDGVMVIPIGESIFKFEKISDEDFYETEYPGFSFVSYVE